MDISYWTKSNPDIKIGKTTKKYFGKYLYKLVVFAPAARVIDAKEPVTEALAFRRELQRTLGSYGTFHIQFSKRLDDDKADPAFLEVLKTMRHSDTVKMRIEEPMVQFYANNEQHLKDIADKFAAFPTHYIETIAGPENAQSETLLNNGAIIRKTDNGYKYKIIIRDGRYDSSIKRSLLLYLQGLGAEHAMVSKNCIDTLKRSSSYIWGLYFYANDIGIITFLNLIHPNIVLNYHEIVTQ